MKLSLSLTLLAIFTSFSPVSADECSGCPGLCGKVVNNTPFEMRYTANPTRNQSARPHLCHFHNWYVGALDQLNGEDLIVGCTQFPIPGGQNREVGGCGQNIDVDGFTFPNNRYFYAGVFRNPGVWTKFGSQRTVRCHYRDQQILC